MKAMFSQPTAWHGKKKKQEHASLIWYTGSCIRQRNWDVLLEQNVRKPREAMKKKKSSVGSSKKNKNKLFIKCYVHEEQVRGHLGFLISFFLNKTQHILVFFFVSFKFSLRSLDTSYIVC